ncbi:sugar phosphate isomerase/epimerase [Micromonospora sp. DR5-3]|uniref:sugar phosphate isomerase/epimerase family protein n=1 Tax=unclassified Micromonospora TaxID=2617518 RepID=UPI0011DC1A6A|nr:MULTISPECIES: sugar phosphate isomerase/epimerase [unclassified Micromonospora]MCW3819075.1 sugar phosphate isomerase/epimerase [Micromonospora sp. DR5-3]TYC20376.1 sugar phosphate isomerase/epimerase [Micromonospora sp. MP36]
MTAGQPISVNGVAALGRPLADELAIYREAGAELIGLPAGKLEQIGWATALDEVRASGLTVAYLFMPLTCHPSDDAGWAAQARTLAAALDAAAALGAGTLYLTSGPSGELSWEEAADSLAERLAPAIGRAARLGVALAVENTMSIRGDLSFTHTLQDAAALARRLDIGLCVDLYCCWQERGLVDTLRAELDRVRLVQVSDFRLGTLSLPNRWVPGDGDIPLERLLRQLTGLGYHGLLDLELLGPAIEAEGTPQALARAVRWLTSRLGR